MQLIYNRRMQVIRLDLLVINLTFFSIVAPATTSTQVLFIDSDASITPPERPNKRKIQNHEPTVLDYSSQIIRFCFN